MARESVNSGGTEEEKTSRRRQSHDDVREGEGVTVKRLRVRLDSLYTISQSTVKCGIILGEIHKEGLPKGSDVTRTRNETFSGILTSEEGGRQSYENGIDSMRSGLDRWHEKTIQPRTLLAIVISLRLTDILCCCSRLGAHWQPSVT